MENEFDRILKNVRKESLDEGIDIGRSEGIDIGLKRGRNEGIEIGAKKNALHSARTMITDGALPLSKVARPEYYTCFQRGLRQRRPTESGTKHQFY